MKKLDLTKPVLNLQGEPYKDEDKKEDLTFAKVIGGACSFALEEDTGEQKYTDFKIGVRVIQNPKDVELTLEEKARIKLKVGKLYPPITVGRVWDLLES